MAHPIPAAGRGEPDSAQDAARSDPVVANARLTASVGAVLLLLFAVEGVTILIGVSQSLPTHVFIGLLVVPPVLLKLSTTTYRMVRYYQGDRRFVRRGPPPIGLRLIGPVVGLTTVALIGTGVADVLLGPSHVWGALHKLSFIGWFAVMTIHVLGHARETPRLAGADWRAGTADRRGRVERRMLVAAALVVGLGLAWWSLTWIGSSWTQGGKR